MSKHIVKQTEWAICYCDDDKHIVMHEMSSEQAEFILKQKRNAHAHKVKITKYIEWVKGY